MMIQLLKFLLDFIYSLHAIKDTVVVLKEFSACQYILNPNFPS